MDLLLIPFRDLLKYKIISSINTGDKNGDTAFTTFCIACVSFILSKEIWSTIYNWLYRYYCIWYIKRHPHIKTTENVAMINVIGKKPDCPYITITIAKGYQSSLPAEFLTIKNVIHYILTETMYNHSSVSVVNGKCFVGILCDSDSRENYKLFKHHLFK